MYFSKDDFNVFAISGFKERMQALKEKIRPKLALFGEECAPLLRQKFKMEFFAHTAKHLRRKINPPDETWVALGPIERGYKAYIFYSLCIGKEGLQARVIMKDESANRSMLAENLLKNSNFFAHQKKLKELKSYLSLPGKTAPFVIEDLPAYLKETTSRLQNLKSALFDVGLDLDPKSRHLKEEFLQAAEILHPFYLCGYKSGIRL